MRKCGKKILEIERKRRKELNGRDRKRFLHWFEFSRVFIDVRNPRPLIEEIAVSGSSSCSDSLEEICRLTYDKVFRLTWFKFLVMGSRVSTFA